MNNEEQLNSFAIEKQMKTESLLSETGNTSTHSAFGHGKTEEVGKETSMWPTDKKTSSLDHSNAEGIQIKSEIPLKGDTYASIGHYSNTGEKPVRTRPADNTEEDTVEIKTEIQDTDYPPLSSEEKGMACELEQYVCKIGQEALKNAISHKKPKVQTGKSSSNAEERPHACQFCEKRFHKTTGLAVHMHTHTGERPYKCETCGKSFAQPCTLRTHKFIHTEEKSHTCEICLKAFRLPNQLKRHMATHSDQQPFSCEICGKKFNDRSNRSLHMRMQHSTESLYSCDQCEKEFRYACNLKTHKLTHTGEKPYTCNICLKQYTRSCSYNMHMLTHTGERPFSCVNCEKTFRFKSNLNMHVSRCHNK